ncbi:MAG: EamA family transporter [Candidatus Pacebacteria bacterium]|nr:EamA family transporter [Candidatus Paceibacterota bacterium]
MSFSLGQYAWFFIAILSYLFFAISSLGDKILLARSPKPRAYTFYVSLLSVIAIFAIPFVDFDLPSGIAALWIVLDAIIYIAGLFGLFSALEKFDASSVVPAIGAAQPIFIFGLTYVFWGPQPLGVREILAFGLLLIGTLLISIDQDSRIFTKESLKLSLVTATLFSMDFVFSKFIFLDQPFWQGFIWIRITTFIMAIFLLLNKNFYRDIFESKEKVSQQTGAIFFLAQGAGGAATVLQSFAIALVPIVYLPFMNALKGLQYAFVFIFVVFFTFYFPKLLKEKVTLAVIAQKTISILVIALGLAILFLQY